MAINIKLNDVSISDHAKVITGVRMSETADFDVQAEKVKVYGDAQFLTDMQIESVVKKAENALQELPASSPEYSSLRKIVQNSKSKNKREVLRKIGIHLGHRLRYREPQRPAAPQAVSWAGERRPLWPRHPQAHHRHCPSGLHLLRPQNCRGGARVV